MKKIPVFFLLCFISCIQPVNNKPEAAAVDTAQIKLHLLGLEKKWIEAEFALDTVFLHTLLDSSFYSVNTDHISNKQEEISGIYKNMAALRQDSIFLDSVTTEDAIVNVYGNTAVAIFTAHTYKKDKGRPVEKRMRFYDVWVNRNGNWKAAASQGTVLSQ